MYRDSDIRTFVILSALANVFVLAAFILGVVYHFFLARTLYRDVALSFLIVSWLLKMQLFLQKIEIMEIRLENLMQSGMKRSKLTIGAENLFMLLYFVLFWVTMAAVLLGFIPIDRWRLA